MPVPQDDCWIAQAVDRYEGPLTLYAARVLAGAGSHYGIDVERARDVVQDTFLRLWESDRASVNGHLAQWLYRVCRNCALDVRRKESRMTTMLETTNVRDQRAEVGAQRSEVSRQRRECTVESRAFGRWAAAGNSQRSTLNSQLTRPRAASGVQTIQ